MSITPLLENGVQNLVLVEKTARGTERRVICEVLYLSLKGIYGSAPR